MRKEVILLKNNNSADVWLEKNRGSDSDLTPRIEDISVKVTFRKNVRSLARNGANVTSYQLEGVRRKKSFLTVEIVKLPQVKKRGEGGVKGAHLFGYV